MALRTAPELIPQEHLHYYEAPTSVEMESRQHWRSLNPEIKRDYIIAERLTPFRVLFDFSTLTTSDLVHVEAHAELFGPNLHESRWTLLEEHAIGIIGQDGVDYLGINRQAANRGRLIIIEPLHGPWVVKLTYQQFQGLSKPVRLMLL